MRPNPQQPLNGLNWDPTVLGIKVYCQAFVRSNKPLSVLMNVTRVLTSRKKATFLSVLSGKFCWTSG